MKTLLKSVGIAIFNLIILFLLTLLFDNMDGLIAGSFYGGGDIKDWWYEFNRDDMLNYLIATATLSGCLCLIYEMAVYYARNRIRFVLGIVIGCAGILVSTAFYWNYIQTHCYGHEWSTLESAFSISYGNNASQVAFWIVYSNLMFGLGIFANRFDVLIQNKERKIIWHQVYFGEDVFCSMLCTGVPYGIFLSGTYFIVGFMGITIKTLFIIFSVAVVLWFFVSKARQYSVLHKYYLCIAESLSKLEHLVIVQESQYIQKSFFIQYLYKNKTFKRMEDRGVWFFPYEMGLVPDNFIKLDIYDEWMFIRSDVQKKRIFSSMSELRGIFNLAFTSDSLSNSTIEYDGEFSGIEGLSNEIERLEGCLNYKKIIAYEIDKIDLTKLNKSNCISEEISCFKRYMKTLTDDFLSFDYAIKWLEITNYLFVLVGISKTNLLISANMQKILEYADFSKWRSIMNEISNEDSDLQNAIMNTESERIAFNEFENLWNIVTSRQYKFKKYTVEELLDGANKIRDYTRGHGVFTFDISQSINISLIKILVFLVNRLIDYLGSAEDLENLEKIGWVIYSGDVPYYLYSVDKKFKEFKYESLQMGNSISLPLDIYG